MSDAAAANTSTATYYIKKGLKTKKSELRVDTEPGRLATYIIDQIPKKFDIYSDYDLAEAHQAQAIVDTCGRYFRYCPEIGWMAYHPEDGCWKEPYAESALQELINHFANLRYEGAVNNQPEELRFAFRCLSAYGINAVKNILKHHISIIISQDVFDADPYLLNCKGELYDLKKGTCRPAAPEDYLSRSMYCKAKAEGVDKKNGIPIVPKKFEEFLKKITSKDGVPRIDLGLYLLYWFGYCLSGDTGASFFLNFHGEGDNGKSVLLDLMLKLFGDYGAAIPEDVVLENRFGSQFDLAGLPGIRLGILSDAPEGRLNMRLLKPIISGNAIDAKRKFMKNFTFKSMVKITIGSNPRITLRETGKAVRRRLRMVPFDYTVTDEEKKPHYDNVLLEDGPAIIALLIFFAKQYFDAGGGPGAFPACKPVDEASRQFIESEDLVGRYVKERIEDAPGKEVGAKEIYTDFKKWSAGEGIVKVMGKNKFGDHLSVHIPNKRHKENGNFYQGIAIKLWDDGGG